MVTRSKKGKTILEKQGKFILPCLLVTFIKSKKGKKISPYIFL
jgi:hypothetical protein